MTDDTRLVGTTAEAIFLSLLNQKNIVAYFLDANSFDGIVFDMNNEYFKVGKSPFFVQIKCRGSKTSKPNPQGHSPDIFDKILTEANRLKIPETSIYAVMGFYKNNDIRDINYYIIPFNSLGYFKSEINKQYRFSVNNCEDSLKQSLDIVKI